MSLFINTSLSVLETEDDTEALKNMESRSGERNTQETEQAKSEGTGYKI